jgi:hypothetical protein
MKSGWLDEQVKRVSEDMKSWDAWMRRDAGIDVQAPQKSGQDRKNPSSSKTDKK